MTWIISLTITIIFIGIIIQKTDNVLYLYSVVFIGGATTGVLAFNTIYNNIISLNLFLIYSIIILGGFSITYNICRKGQHYEL